MWLVCVQILKIKEVGELFEEARGTLNKKWFVLSKNYRFIKLYKSCRVGFLTPSFLSSSLDVSYT